MNNNISKIWAQLESEKHAGLVKRMFQYDSAFKIYCVQNTIDHSYGIALSFVKGVKFNLKPFSNLSHLKVEVYEDSSFGNSLLLCAMITDADKRDIFSYLCGNVITSIQKSTNITQAVKTFENTLLKWKNLFDLSHQRGLSNQEQQGLYGELLFLKKILEFAPDNAIGIIQTYVGCSKAIHDFQGSIWAVEVKTTSTNNPRSLTIHGAQQLDNSMFDKLFLCHCSLVATSKAGISLPDLICKLRQMLSSDLAALSIFNAKLFEAGYNDEDVHLYLDKYYQLRNMEYYQVKDIFPRIIAKDLQEGIGNIEYEIMIAACAPYCVNELLVVDTCINND